MLLSMGFESLCMHLLIASKQCSLVPTPRVPRLGTTPTASAAVLRTLTEEQNPAGTGRCLAEPVSIGTAAQTLTGQCLCLPLSGYWKHTYQGMEPFNVYLPGPLNSFEAWFTNEALTATEITLESISSQLWWLIPVDSCILRYLWIMQMCFILQSMCQTVTVPIYCAS